MDKLHFSEIYSTAGLRLFVLFSTEFYCRFHNTASVYGTCQPVAIIVCRGSDIYALDTDGVIIPLEELAEKVPEIDTLIVSDQSK